jgi:arabinose-5-phosphate isomerase
MEARSFDRAQYLRLHPKGAIGVKLSLPVSAFLRGASTNPTVGERATFREALETITRFTQGGVSVVDEQGRLAGIVTDGDVRRAIQAAEGAVDDLMRRPITAVMTRSPSFVRSRALAIDAVRQMETHRPRPIYLLPVVGDDDRVEGLIHVHALVQAGLVSDPA